MFERIYNILVEILGESKQGSYSSDTEQYQFNCPCCAEENGSIPDGKYNLEILLSKDKGFKYHCWKCGETDGTRGNISKLIKKYGSYALYHSYKEEIEALKNCKLYNLKIFDDYLSNPEKTFIKLPKTYTKINLETCKNFKVKDYLKSRKIDQFIIDKFKIGYTTWDEKDFYMRNRIIIPSYDSFGDLNYFVGRDFSGKSVSKYKNCDADKKDIIFQESLIDWDANIVLVEGAIDCLYYPNTISLLGKSLSKDSALYKTLVGKANADIIICIDADTDINETKRIYSLLDFGKLKNKIKYVRLDKYKDFGELYESLGKNGIIKTLRNAKQFNDLELIF